MRTMLLDTNLCFFSFTIDFCNNVSFCVRLFQVVAHVCVGDVAWDPLFIFSSFYRVSRQDDSGLLSWLEMAMNAEAAAAE